MAEAVEVRGGPVRTYALLAWTWMRAAAQFPASLTMLTLTSILVSALDLIAILIIFGHTQRLGGFTRAEVMFCYGTAGVSFALADTTLGTASRLGQHVREGTLDAFLLRPVSPLIQIATEDFSPRRMGKIVPGTVVLVLSLTQLGDAGLRLLIVPVMIVCGALIFGSLWVLSAALQFFIIDGREAMSSVTYGGGFLTQYPLSIYSRDLVRGLTWVVPLAFINWQPALYVLDHPDPLGLPLAFRFASPVAAAVLVALAALAWRAGLRHYHSTGS